MVHTFLRHLRGDSHLMSRVVSWHTEAAQPPDYRPAPAGLDPRLVDGLARRSIHRLYSHQAAAVAHALAGRNVAVVTPTASGKSLCYHLPVLDALLQNPAARAIYLFPTKALAHDQLADLDRWSQDLRWPGMLAAAYDGDTPAADRPRLRKQARILLTNPDMLHAGILPGHLQWADFLANLQFVVVDEMHSYRGVFGSHVANVLRRLQRLVANYGGHCRFVLASATIANPQELAERLIEQPVTCVEETGAPRGERHLLIVNPPLVDPERGIRRSPVLEATEWASRALESNIQTIVFGRSRLSTELLLTYLRERGRRQNLKAVEESIRGYRGGYLPAERRAIEAGLRSGQVRAVVATNALELGIDIGQMEASILCSYPGSIAALRQQWGRAGRSTGAAVGVLVAGAGALDQYVVAHPEYLFGRSPERALINPDNPLLLLDHLRCALFELPFQRGDRFGGCEFVDDALDLLVEQGEATRQRELTFWQGGESPARRISLRTAGSETVTIENHAGGAPQVIGQVDGPSARRLVHDGAIYLHEGQSFLVRQLEMEQLRAVVAPVDADYYTQPLNELEVTVLETHEERTTVAAQVAFGNVAVQEQVVGYRRIRKETHETLSSHGLEYPPQRIETGAYWCAVSAAVQQQLELAGLWFDSINDYGPNWTAAREAVRTRDRHRCTVCGAGEPPGREHDVHHKLPFRLFGYVRGVNERYREANRLENLTLVCRTCHRRLETAGTLRTGLDGVAYLLSNLAPLHLMCDPSDLGVHVAKGNPIGLGAGPAAVREMRTRPASPVFQIGEVDFYVAEERPPASPAGPGAAEEVQPASLSPTIYLYERIPAGLGFNRQLYQLHETLLAAALGIVRRCPCEQGCPGCVGPVLEESAPQLETKRLTLALLEALSE